MQCIDAGRSALLKKWNAAPFTAGQSEAFAVSLSQEELDDAGAIDVFVARNKNVRAEISKEWQRFCDAHGLALRHDKRDFYIDVPHSYYLSRTKWKMQTSAACIQDSLGIIVAALALMVVAYYMLDA